MVAIFLEVKKTQKVVVILLCPWKMVFYFLLTEFSRKVMFSHSLYLVRCAEMVAGHYSSACQEQSQVHIFGLLVLLWLILGK